MCIRDRLPGSPRRGPPGGRGESAPYDVIVSDLPDPGITASTKLYSQEFYGLAARLLAPGGRLVVHAGAPTERPRSYWTVEATMRSVGLATVPYRVPGQPADFSGAPDRATGPEGSLPPGRCSAVPAPGGNTFWGFVLAARRPPRLDLAPDAPPLASVTRAGLRADERGAAADRIPFLRPSTLMHPRYQG